MSENLRAAIIQDDVTSQILMLGWMDEEALALTKSTGLVHFFSRSRQTLWKKGETSGNTMHVIEIIADCDDDALVVRVSADGQMCIRDRSFVVPLAARHGGDAHQHSSSFTR